jgi:heat shock protein HslJ
MKPITRLLTANLLTAILVIGCSSAGASPSPSPATLDGHTYLSTDLQGAVLVAGSRIRLTFTNGSLSASGGCNTMGGAYSIDGDRLVTTQMSMTEMACDEPLMRQDTWLGAFLGGVTFTIDGDTLTLVNGAVRLALLDEEVATPDKPIEGTRWVLDGIISGDAVSSVPIGVTASIKIAGGQVQVEAGCNTGGGSVTVAADTLAFGGIGLTKMGCEAGPAAVESAVMTVLTGDVAYAIDADSLTLMNGANGLMFRAAP